MSSSPKRHSATFKAKSPSTPPTRPRPSPSWRGPTRSTRSRSAKGSSSSSTASSPPLPRRPPSRRCAVSKNHPWPQNGAPGKAPIRPRERPSARDDRKNPTSRAFWPPGAAGAVRRGVRVGGRDRRGQRRTAGDLDSCQPGSDTPGLSVGLRAGGRPPSSPGPHDHSTAGPPARAVRKPHRLGFAEGVPGSPKARSPRHRSRPTSR